MKPSQVLRQPALYLHAGRLSLAALCISLSGCAYLTTYNKQVSLDGQQSLAMDVKQRVVISQKREDKAGKTTVVTCAEPSPDALTVIGASLGGSLNLARPDSTTASANVAAALSESGAFVGLRTQSIQLLRDAMYRLCEGYAAGAIDGNEYEGLQRRFQSTVLGLLAIEQLTKPVVAGQALLASAAGGGAGAGANDTQVQAAQQRVTEQRAKVTTAESALDAKEAALSESMERFRAEQAKLPKASEEERTAIAAEIEKARLQVQKDELAVRAAERDLQRERTVLAEAQTALQRAESAATAFTSGGGSLGAVARATADSSQSLATAVGDIVAEINKSYMRDTCFNLYARLLYRQADAALRAADLEVDLAKGAVKNTPEAQERLRTLLSSSSDRLNTGSQELKTMCGELLQAQSNADQLKSELKLSQQRLEAATKELQAAQARAASGSASAPTPATPRAAPAVRGRPSATEPPSPGR